MSKRFRQAVDGRKTKDIWKGYKKMNNKKLGSDFEQELCEILSSHGFWVHPMRQDNSGQPADIIAVRNKVSYLIDAKVCSNDTFPFSRIEENQDLAMELWHDCGNGIGWFALKLRGQIYMHSHYTMKAYRHLKNSLSPQEIFELGMPIEKWVKKCK
jgi:Holliday junction resolvase